eukprot:6656449-Prorocentrum_lima.AAC.1
MQVVQDLLDEAEAESRGVQSAIEENHLELFDDLDVSDEDRAEIRHDNSLLEVEFRHWCKLYASRCKEKQIVEKDIA